MPTLKGYEYRIRGYDHPDYVMAATASKARYRVMLDLGDVVPDLKFSDITIRRDPSRDVTFPDVPPVNDQLDARDRETVLNAYGGGSHIRPNQWGYRDHQCLPPKDERINRLTKLGLFRGPYGVDENGDTSGWAGAFWYLTDAGKELARALIGARETSQED